MNGLHFFFGVGSLVAPLLVAQVLPLSAGAAWAYWIISLVTLPLGLSVLRLGTPASPASPQDASRGPSDRRLFGLIVLFFFLYTGAEVGFSGWVFSWAIADHGVSQTTAAYLTSAFWGAFTLGRLASIPLTRKVRVERILLGSLLGGLLSLSLLLLFASSSVGLWLGTVGVGLSMASIFPGTLSFARARVAITGRSTSRIFLCSGLGGMVLPWLVGVLFGTVGPGSVIPAFLVDLVLSLLVMVVLFFPEQPSRRAPAG